MTQPIEITSAQLQNDTARILEAVQAGRSAAIVDSNRQVVAWLVPPQGASRQPARRSPRPEPRDEPPVREIEPEARSVDPGLAEALRRVHAATGGISAAGAVRKARIKDGARGSDYLARQRLHQPPAAGEQGIGR